MTTTTPAPATVPAVPAGGPASRLRNGELRAMVAKVLHDNTGTAMTPRAIAQILGRSSGAVGNACKTLALQRDAQVAATSPLTYGATATTASVAVSAITPGLPSPSGTSTSAERMWPIPWRLP